MNVGHDAMNVDDYAEQASEVFVLSDSFIRIKELVDDESSSIDDISEVILLDPALVATILKLANSSFFKYPGKIDTVSKAVLVLGITEVYSLVIAFFTQKAFKQINAEQSYLDEFWSKSVDCALIVKFIGSKFGIPNAERLFILGLLHNLGELIIHQFTPDKVLTINTESSTELPWQCQQQLLGFTYGQCTAKLLKCWQLPFVIIEPIRNQDVMQFDSLSTESKLLHLAKRIMLVKYNDKLPVEDVLTEAILQQFPLEQELLQEVAYYCELERMSILAILNPGAATVF